LSNIDRKPQKEVMNMSEKKRKKEEELIAVLVSFGVMIGLLFWILRGCSSNPLTDVLPAISSAVPQGTPRPVGTPAQSDSTQAVPADLSNVVVTVSPASQAETVGTQTPASGNAGSTAEPQTQQPSQTGGENPKGLEQVFFQLPQDTALVPGSYTLVGIAPAGRLVNFFVDGQPVGSATADANGDWQAAIPLVAGTNNVSVQLLSADGATVEQTMNLPAMTVAEAQPQIMLDPLPEFGFVNEPILLSGSGIPNSKFDLLVGAESVPVQVGADGKWAVAYTPTQSGSLQVSYTGEGLAIPTIAVYAPTTVNVPTAPLQAGQAFVLSGTGAPNVEITVLLNGKPYPVQVDGAGNWELPVTWNEAGDLQIDAPGLKEPLILAIATNDPELGAIATGSPATSAATNAAISSTDATATAGADSSANATQLATATAGAINSNNATAAPVNTATATPVPPTATTVPPSNTPKPSATPTKVSASGSGGNTNGTAIPCSTSDFGRIENGFYIVGRCNTLTNIAKRLGVSVEQLIQANPQLSNPNYIYPGQKLNLPNFPTVTASPQGTGNCISGDYGYLANEHLYIAGQCSTLTNIAALLKINLADLIAANPQISNPDIIHVGQAINIP
jgi:LysM repeat protein